MNNMKSLDEWHDTWHDKSHENFFSYAFFHVEIEHTIANSRNSEELKYVWSAWQDAAGKPIRGLYNEYIDLSNRAAEANGTGIILKSFDIFVEISLLLLLISCLIFVGCSFNQVLRFQ